MTLNEYLKRFRSVKCSNCVMSWNTWTFRQHCSQSWVYSDEKTWCLWWKIALENPGNTISRVLNLKMCLDASIGPQELAPLVRVPKPPTIHYSFLLENFLTAPDYNHICYHTMFYLNNLPAFLWFIISAISAIDKVTGSSPLPLSLKIL